MAIPPSLAQPSVSQAPLEETDPNAIAKSIVDAKGDLITATGNDSPARLAVGSDGQVLVADSTTAEGVAWATDPTTAVVDAKGDLLAGTAADTITRLPVGADGQVLVADSSTGTGLAWSSETDPNSINKAIIDAKGDLVVGVSDDTPGRLGVGTDGQVLTANSATTEGVEWATLNVTLGTETNGDYVQSVSGGTGVTVTGGTGEGSSPSVAIGQDVATSATVAFAGLNVDSGTLYVDSANNRVGINNTSPTVPLEVTGDSLLDGNVTITGRLDAAHIHGELAGPVYLHVKNTSGASIPAGYPVYATGSVGASGATEVSASNASTAATMPALGILSTTLAHNGEGHAIIVGVAGGLNTLAYSVNTTLYVAPGGGLTSTRPTSSTDAVQAIGRVIRSDSSTGEILVQGAGRRNDVPNAISIGGDITTTTGVFYGDGSGLTNLNASNLASGTVPSTAIGNDSIALGTKTTGDYVQTVTGGTGVSVTGGTGEGSTPTVAIGQAVAATDSPTFAGLTTTGTANLNALTVTGSASANAITSTTSLTGASLFVDSIEIDTTGATSNQVLQYDGTKFAPTTLTSSGIPSTIVDAKGDIIVATADDTVTRLAVGSTGQGLVVDSTTATGLKWAAVGDVTLTGTQTLTNKTLTSPVIENGELDQSSSGIPSKITALVEGVYLHGYTPGSFMDLMYNPSGGQGHVQYWTTDTNQDFFVYCYAAYGFDTIMSVGQSLTMVAIVKNGATAYKPSSVTITGWSTVNVIWQGGGGIPAGNANAHDVYTFNIVKTASGTATVFASQTSFA